MAKQSRDIIDKIFAASDVMYMILFAILAIMLLNKLYKQNQTNKSNNN